MTWQSAGAAGASGSTGRSHWANESYFLADRHERQRPVLRVREAADGGVQFDLPYRLRLDVSAGYVFDRFYFQGKQYSDRNRDRVNVGAGVFGQVQLRLQF